MKTVLIIQNLKCGGCAHTITTKLENLESIKDVSVNTETDSVTFSHEDESQIESVVNMLSKLGYPVSDSPNSLSKKAKSYMSCAIGRMNS